MQGFTPYPLEHDAQNSALNSPYGVNNVAKDRARWGLIASPTIVLCVGYYHDDYGMQWKSV
jgi:hypothetical protein